eukprot:COSAG05_NODE_277_length_12336_cov_419.763668_13_plen_38_part_00
MSDGPKQINQQTRSESERPRFKEIEIEESQATVCMYV